MLSSGLQITQIAQMLLLFVTDSDSLVVDIAAAVAVVVAAAAAQWALFSVLSICHCVFFVLVINDSRNPSHAQKMNTHTETSEYR